MLVASYSVFNDNIIYPRTPFFQYGCILYTTLRESFIYLLHACYYIVLTNNNTCIAYFRTNFYWVTVTLHPAVAYIHTLLVYYYILHAQRLPLPYTFIYSAV